MTRDSEIQQLDAYADALDRLQEARTQERQRVEREEADERMRRRIEADMERMRSAGGV